MTKSMKRILLGCLAFAMISLFKTEARAELDSNANVRVGDVIVVENGEVATDLPAGISFDESTTTLTLTNYICDFDVTTESWSIIFAGGISDFRLQLVGKNILNCHNAPTQYDSKSGSGSYASISGIVGGYTSFSIYGGGSLEMNLGSFENIPVEAHITGIRAFATQNSISNVNIVINAEGEEVTGITGYAISMDTVDLTINSEDSRFNGITNYENLQITNSKLSINSKNSEATDKSPMGGIRIGIHSPKVMLLDHSDITMNLGRGNNVCAITSLNFSGSNPDSKIITDHANIVLKVGSSPYNTFGTFSYYTWERIDNPHVYVGDDIIEKEVDPSAYASEMKSIYASAPFYGFKDHTVVISSEPTEIPSPIPFADVFEADWYYDYIQFVARNGIMNGMGDGTNFAPTDTIVRAQFANILYNMNGKPATNYFRKFPDVTRNDWFVSPVLWAYDAKVVGGYDNGYFGPSDPITREQIAVMLYRYTSNFGKRTRYPIDWSGNEDVLGRFIDADQVNDYGVYAMQWAVLSGIITGKDNETRLAPQETATRAECATIMMRYYKLYEQ